MILVWFTLLLANAPLATLPVLDTKLAQTAFDGEPELEPGFETQMMRLRLDYSLE